MVSSEAEIYGRLARCVPLDSKPLPEKYSIQGHHPIWLFACSILLKRVDSVASCLVGYRYGRRDHAWALGKSGLPFHLRRYTTIYGLQGGRRLPATPRYNEIRGSMLS
jgi:hypothetical protein